MLTNMNDQQNTNQINNSQKVDNTNTNQAPGGNPPVVAKKSNKILIITIIAIVLIMVVATTLIVVWAILGRQNNPTSINSPNRLSTPCYSFDMTRLKKNNFNSKALHKCEVSIMQDNAGYYPVADILVYPIKNSLSLEEAVAVNEKEIRNQKATNILKKNLTLDGVKAVLLTWEKPVPSNVHIVDIGDNSVQESFKDYALFADITGVVKSKVGDEIGNMIIMGSYNKPNDKLLDRIIKSWEWK